MKTRVLFLVLLLITLGAFSASAQTAPTVPVLGVGSLAFDVPADVVTAQAQAYRAYVGTNPAVRLTVACVASATAGASTCSAPLSALPLTSAGQTVALSSAVVAADGEVETAKVSAPFVLALAPKAVAPTGNSARIRAAP